MRYIIALAALCFVIGGGLVLQSLRFPFYTDQQAPERISRELDEFPQDSRSREWYARLHSYETPRKRLSDLGRGLLAAGVGLAGAIGIWVLYHRFPSVRSTSAILFFWIVLWGIRIPFTFWYYGLRQTRFDYPVWGDSIAIPIFSESIAWVFGAIVSSVLLGLLLIRHPLPSAVHFRQPRSIHGWIRAGFIACWLAVLTLCVVSGVYDGDEGMVIACSMAAAILLIFLAASEKSASDQARQTADDPATSRASEAP